MGLLYMNDHVTGIARIKTRTGFLYLDKNGRQVRDRKTLARINNLVIPPMWENVWISPNPNGHIQATGRDQKGRKQYIYHPTYKAQQQTAKFTALFEFGKNLTAIREKVQHDLRRRTWDKDKMLAIVIDLLDEYYLRIGNECYQDENGTFGATTLRKKHVRLDKDGLVLQYKAKAGKIRKINLKKGQLANLVRKCSELPGHELFRYMENGKPHCLESSDVNNYLEEITGHHFTSKTFRTWGGSVLTLEKIPEAMEEILLYPKRKFEAVLVKHVSKELGNTQSVCKNYYMHPKVLEFARALAEGKKPEMKLKPLHRSWDLNGLTSQEKLLMKIIHP